MPRKEVRGVRACCKPLVALGGWGGWGSRSTFVSICLTEIETGLLGARDHPINTISVTGVGGSTLKTSLLCFSIFI